MALHQDICKVGIATNVGRMVVNLGLDAGGVEPTARTVDAALELDDEQRLDALMSILVSSKNSKFVIEAQ